MTYLNTDISIFNQDEVETDDDLGDVSGDEESLTEDENLEDEGLEDENLGDEK